jgi:hypothetical protein
MRDHEHRPPVRQLPHGLGDALGVRGVEVGRGLVEDDELRVAEERARKREPLALAGRE